MQYSQTLQNAYPAPCCALTQLSTLVVPGLIITGEVKFVCGEMPEPGKGVLSTSRSVALFPFFARQRG